MSYGGRATGQTVARWSSPGTLTPVRGGDHAAFVGTPPGTRTLNPRIQRSVGAVRPGPGGHERPGHGGRAVQRGPRLLGRVRSLGYTIGYIETDPYCQPGKSTAPEHRRG